MRNWRSVFGPPEPAGYTLSSISENHLRMILRVALSSDTDLLLRSWRVVVIKEAGRIHEVAALFGNSDTLRSASILVLVGVENRESLADLTEFNERLAANQPGSAQFERYKLAVGEPAFSLWLGGAAARCATRMCLAARSLGYSSAVLETFDSANLRAFVGAPPEVDFPIVVSIGGTMSQRGSESIAVASDELVFSERWGKALDLSEAAESTIYSDCLVSYFDILGFRHMIDAWGPEQIKSGLDALLALSSQDLPLRRVTLRGLSTFSDHVVRTVPLDGLGGDEILATVQFELSQIQHVQANLVVNGIFVRGAMTRGSIYINDEIVFGPALVHAYEMEQKVAIYPRIVVDRTTVIAGMQSAVGKENMTRLCEDYLFYGEDEQWSVNYLQAGDELGERLTLLKGHSKVLRRKLSEISDSAVLAKFRWLADFQNSIVAQLADADVARYGLTRAELQIP
ncbi:MAG: nitroreductase family protein [Candidatus Acidiferrales bacterium]